MTEVVAAAAPPQKQFHLKRLVIWLALIVVIGVVAYLLGWNIRGWFSELWDTLTQISVKYLVPALVLQTLQTLFTAVAWLAIIRYAYPDSGVPARQVIACYATSVALNTFLPANLGTLVMLIMFTAIIVGATFAGIFAGYLVEKIFFTVIGAVVYVYLFVSVGGSFDIKFGWVSAHPWATAIIASRRRVRSRDPLPARLALAEEALGAGQAGWQNPGRLEGVSRARLLCRNSLAGAASWV